MSPCYGVFAPCTSMSCRFYVTRRSLLAWRWSKLYYIFIQRGGRSLNDGMLKQLKIIILNSLYFDMQFCRVAGCSLLARQYRLKFIFICIVFQRGVRSGNDDVLKKTLKTYLFIQRGGHSLNDGMSKQSKNAILSLFVRATGCSLLARRCCIPINFLRSELCTLKQKMLANSSMSLLANNLYFCFETSFFNGVVAP